MADIKKFLDQGGVSTLWSRITEELNKKATNDALNEVKTTANNAKTAAEENAAQISLNKASIKANTDDITILKGDATKEGSVAYQIAQIVAGAGESFDTLKEIADWIANHGTTATEMQSNITSLKTLVGDTKVADQITAAITAVNLDQYATASALADAVTRIGNLESAGGQSNVIEAIKVNGTAVSVAADKSVNIGVPVVQALTTEEINAAITAASGQA